MLPQKTSPGATAAAVCVVAGALAACAMPGGAAGEAPLAQTAQPMTQRVLVELARPGDDPTAIAAEAARAAGVPVSYAAAVSPTRHALVVRCETAAQCNAAIGRMRAATAIYQAVEIDGRKTRLAS